MLYKHGMVWCGIYCDGYLYAGTKGERWWGIMDVKDGGCEGRGQGAGPALGVICGGEVRCGGGMKMRRQMEEEDIMTGDVQHRCLGRRQPSATWRRG